MTLLKDNTFFKPTPLYKEFTILDLIEKNKNITQREIAETVGVAVSMVNAYLDDYEKKKFIRRRYITTKTIEYYVTKSGVERIRLLSIGYLNHSLKIYNSAKENISGFLSEVIENGFYNILLYGAGEVAEILLQTIILSKGISPNVIGIIDDDQLKHNSSLLDTKILPFEMIDKIEHDGILISSYTNKSAIMKKLNSINYDSDKILQFFNQ